MIQHQSAKPDTLRSALSDRLKAAREEAGFSLRRAASEAGIRPSTLHAIERHESAPRLDSLAALLALYPSLTPEDATGLVSRSHGGISSDRGAFLAWVQAFGLRADRVKVSARRIEIEGLRATHADALDETVRRALLRVACQAGGPVRRDLTADVERLSEGRHRHVFAWCDGSLDYHRDGPTTLRWACPFPAQELLFQGPRNSDLNVTATSATGGGDIADRLHHHRRQAGQGLAVVDYPAVGVVYEASPKGEAWMAPLGQVVRRYRKAAGLRLQDVADTAGCSLNSVSAFETSITESPRLETAIGYLRALPDLPLRRVLPGAPRTGKLTPEQLFEQSVAVAGVICDEIEKSLEIEPDGTQHLRYVIRGLRSLGRPLTERGLELPGLPNSAQASHDTLADIADDLEEPAAAFTRSHRFPGGVLTVKWAKRSGVFGATLTRTYEPVARAFAMTEAEAVERYNRPRPIYSGVTMPVNVPAKRAVLRVELPKTPSHCEIGAHLWASAVFPDMTLPPLSRGQLVPLAMSEQDDGLRYTAAADDVLPGQKLAIGWRPQPDA